MLVPWLAKRGLADRDYVVCNGTNFSSWLWNIEVLPDRVQSAL